MRLRLPARTWITVVGLAMLGGGGCGDGGTDPVAGELTFSLGGTASDGAILFTVRSTSPNTVSNLTASCTGCRAFTRIVSDQEIRAAITGPIANGPLFRVTVSDVNASGYSATIQGVAAADFSLKSLSGYTLSPPPPN